MQILSKSKKLFFALITLCFTSLAAETAGEDALQSLIDAEKNFAQMALEKGIREAFLTNLAEDAVVFDPAPVNGKELYRKRPASDAQLTWQPVFADVARAGDLGYTTGPWEYKKGRKQAPSAHGQFLSIWKKQADEKWKVVLDGGIDNPAPVNKAASSETLPNESSDAPQIDLKSVRRVLVAAEKEFDDASAKDAGAALIAAASDNIRVFRNGRFPAVGKDAAQLMISYDHGKMAAKRASGGISRSGDLAYSYGEYVTERQDGTEHGSFVTIWKMSAGGSWKLVVDVRKRHAPTESKT